VIPRIVHRIWLGDAPMPAEYVRYGDTWREHHPKWEMRLWTDEELPEIRDREAFDRGRSEVERSGVLRYEVLRQFGGVYADTDVECLRPLDPLLADRDALMYGNAGQYVNTAVMAFAPGHGCIERLLEEISPRVGNEAWTAGQATGAKIFLPLLAEYPEVDSVSPDLFEPYPASQPHRRDDEFPDAYTVHRWRLTRATNAIKVLRAKEARQRQRIERLEGKLEDSERRRQETADRLSELKRTHRPGLRHRLSRLGGGAR